MYLESSNGNCRKLYIYLFPEMIYMYLEDSKFFPISHLHVSHIYLKPKMKNRNMISWSLCKEFEYQLVDSLQVQTLASLCILTGLLQLTLMARSLPYDTFI